MTNGLLATASLENFRKKSVKEKKQKILNTIFLIFTD